MKILRNHGVEPILIKYLDTPPDVHKLKEISRKLGLEAKNFIRRNEPIYRELGLKHKLDNQEALFHAMASNPKLLERPIAMKGDRAVIGRPPERVLELL